MWWTTTSAASAGSQNMLASKVISYEKEIVQLRLETVKAKEMTKASLKELLLTREELERPTRSSITTRETSQPSSRRCSTSRTRLTAGLDTERTRAEEVETCDD